MSTRKFIADVESGAVPVDSHEQLLRYAYSYLWDGPDGNGVFGVVERLHERGCSFGEGDLRFNRTLDIFYLAQIMTAIYRTDAIYEGRDAPPATFEFPNFYATNHALLHPSAWRSFYSTEFLSQPITARFYRLPNLRALTDSDRPLYEPWPQPAGSSPHTTKLPFWAYCLARTYHRQPLLSLEKLTQLALSTLETVTERLRKDYPSVTPFSVTQAHFWLERMKPSEKRSVDKHVWRPHYISTLITQGYYDLYEWARKYSAQQWETSWTSREVLEPDGMGTWDKQIHWCGWPDGGVEYCQWERGFEPELGSEEEIEFLAAVAVEETAGLEVDQLDYAVRSHILLAVMRAAVTQEGQERNAFLEELEKGMVAKGRITEDKAGKWLQEALRVVEPYVKVWEGVWPDAKEERAEVLRRILVENGNLFARWKVSSLLKEFSFELGPPRVSE